MTLSPLVPVRHKPGDFFIADIFDNLPFKDDMASMEHPLFTLSLKPDMRILRYTSDDGKASIEMQPSAFGLPNIMDKDILLYCASVIMAKINSGEIPPQTIRLSFHDVLVAMNRNTCKKSYDAIKTALNRLAGCLLKTSIKTGRTEQGEMFHLLEKIKYLESTRVKGRILGVEVTLSDWFYNSLIAKEVLTISPEYFRLRKSLDRRIYEIARKHCGQQQSKAWLISLPKLHLKSGSTARESHFRNTIKTLSASDHLPEYSISFDPDTDVVKFTHRTTRKAEGMTVKSNSEACLTLPQNISPDLLEDVRNVVGTGLDYYELWHQYTNWNGSKKAKNARAGFIGFCKKKAGQFAR